MRWKRRQIRCANEFIDPVCDALGGVAQLFHDPVGRVALPGVRLHDLRHSFASRALALGESLPMIGKILGHTQIQTTARYAHLARDMVVTSVTKIGDSIEQDLGLLR